MYKELSISVEPQAVGVRFVEKNLEKKDFLYRGKKGKEKG